MAAPVGGVLGSGAANRTGATVPPIERSPLVLAIDNDGPTARALAMLIGDWGYTCCAAGTLEDGIARLGPRIRDVAAVILDLSGSDPTRSRSTAAAVAKAVGRVVPVLVTSTESESGRPTAVTETLDKPYDPEVLHRWLADRVGLTPGLTALRTG